MKVAIYTRVSTDDKDQNPERQISPCENYCKLHDHETIGVFKEHISGDTSPYTRPVFIEMMKNYPKGIVVFSIDRLSRQHPNKVMQLLNQFKDSGITIISVNEPLFNMESPFAEPLQYFLSWWNNYFLKKLKADIKSGIEKAKIKGTKSGKPIGRPVCKFNEYRAFELLINQNKSLTEVSQELGASRATLHRFKKVAEKNPSLFIKDTNISKTNGYETEMIQ